MTKTNEKCYRVVGTNNSTNGKARSALISKAKADTMAAKMRDAKDKDGAPKWDTVSVVKESQNINEGVLDSIDDDGFMAKRQLYDIAKYAAELHQMIQDTDDLDPWVAAKITKAADYVDTVKHYLEYQDVRDADGFADVIDLPVADPVTTVEPTVEPSLEADALDMYESMTSSIRDKIKHKERPVIDEVEEEIQPEPESMDEIGQVSVPPIHILMNQIERKLPHIEPYGVREKALGVISDILYRAANDK